MLMTFGKRSNIIEVVKPCKCAYCYNHMIAQELGVGVHKCPKCNEVYEVQHLKRCDNCRYYGPSKIFEGHCDKLLIDVGRNFYCDHHESG